MRYQCDYYSCGAAAVVNALRCLGRRVSERSVRSWANTTEADGTNEAGICAAIKGLGFEALVFDSDYREEAVEKLQAALFYGNPVILCTQNSQHWVTVVATLDKERRYLVVDPARTIRNLSENGVTALSQRELVKTWQSRNNSAPGAAFFGIVVKRRRPKKKKNRGRRR